MKWVLLVLAVNPTISTSTGPTWHTIAGWPTLAACEAAAKKIDPLLRIAYCRPDSTTLYTLIPKVPQ